MIPVSVLNLVPMREGQSRAQAIESMIELAQETERIGYTRYWIAEHHNMPSLVSSATQVLIGHTLAHTGKIRVGSGGVMLPNHSPLLVAEQYGTLATIYPDRVDLGIGRAPGTDRPTATALRRNERNLSLNYPNDVQMLQRYFRSSDEQGYVRAFPGVGLNVPIYMLGSSTESAHLAAELGLPFAFAAHFAPRLMDAALEIYRREFKPSDVLEKPYVIVCLNVIAADTDEEARFLAGSQQQFIANIIKNTRQPLQPPVAETHIQWGSEQEQVAVNEMLACSLIGSKASVAAQFEALQIRLRADEIMVVSYIYDQQKQYRSYRLFHEIASSYRPSSL